MATCLPTTARRNKIGIAFQLIKHTINYMQHTCIGNILQINIKKKLRQRLHF